MTRHWPCFLILLGVALACEPTPPTGHVETVSSWRPHNWTAWRELFFVVSPDGAKALNYGLRNELEFVDLTTGQLDQEKLLGDLDRVFGVAFYGEGKMARNGRRGDQRGWFLEGPDGLVLSSLLRRTPSWAPDGSRIVSASGNELMVGLPEEGPRYDLPGNVLGATWSSDGKLVYSLIWNEEEAFGALFSLEPETGEIGLVKEPLDVWRSGTPLTLSSDGRFLYLALASKGAPDPEARHDRDADRDLDIYQLDLGTGQIRVVVDDPGDDFAPMVANGWLYWTHNNYRSSVVFLPGSGGESRLVLDEAECPRWHPNSRRLSFKYGGSRIVDAGLRWDVGVVDVDENGSPVSNRMPIVEGYHQDNWVTWSPDGRWIAFHSHRSEEPVAFYNAEGSADDIFLRRTDASQEEEIRLTDFSLETRNPDWSPDGRKIVFTTWAREEGGASLWTIPFDPNTGEYGSPEEVAVPDGMGLVDWARWSPTGDLAILEVLGAAKRALRIRTASGTWSESLVEIEGHQTALDWTPDGMNIVFSAMADGRMQIFTIPRSGGEPRRLSSDDGYLTFPDVSPDGRWIACTRFDHSQELRRLRLQ